MTAQKTSAKRKRGQHWLRIDQPRLGLGGLLVLLLLGGLMTPFALDMYTPAVPSMMDVFHTTADMVNFTMAGFFISNAVGQLLFGTVSDKYGRKPVLLGGAIAYAVASAVCVFATSIWMLIIVRVFQALGAGAVGAVGMAIIKDAFADEHREKVFSVLQVMFVVGPVAAPVLGAIVLQFTDWHGIFVLLTIIGVGIVVLSCLYTETLEPAQRTQGNLVHTMGNLFTICKHKGFMLFLIVVATMDIPFMAYIAVGSHIYEGFFGLSELAYSGFFAFAALTTALGPIMWIVLSRFTTARKVTTGILTICFLAGIGIIAFGGSSPFVFCGLFTLFATVEAVVRPYSTNILLSQDGTEAGAASSMSNFLRTVFGFVGMLLAVLPWPNYVIGVGALLAGSLAVGLLLWAYMLKKPVRVKLLID